MQQGPNTSTAERAGESEGVFVCERGRDKERKRASEREIEREREKVRKGGTERERERDRERESLQGTETMINTTTRAEVYTRV